ncbi:MAG: hypothetical protein ACI4DP_03500 [Candidatus Ornithomonoglobus sp.]
MDYNYVRMRKAASAGDTVLAEYYKNLYEAGTETKTASPVLNYIIALLAVVAAALFVYIMYQRGVWIC